MRSHQTQPAHPLSSYHTSPEVRVPPATTWNNITHSNHLCINSPTCTPFLLHPSPSHSPPHTSSHLHPSLSHSPPRTSSHPLFYTLSVTPSLLTPLPHHTCLSPLRALQSVFELAPVSWHTGPPGTPASPSPPSSPQTAASE